MKVKSLFIKDYHQFQDFSLDLTYPKGHKKAGQPLDKVCIIGQSGTGKTSLLRFIEYMNKWKEVEKIIQKEVENIIQIESKRFVFNQQVPYMYTDSKIGLDLGSDIKEDNSILFGIVDEVLNGFDGVNKRFVYAHLKNIKYKTIFISTDLQHKFSEFSEVSDNLLKPNTDFIDFEDIHFGDYWNLLKKEITDFQTSILNKRNEFSKLATNLSITTEGLEKAIIELREWENQYKNPLKRIGEDFLDKIINKFNLQVKTEVDVQDIGFIKLETLEGKEVENDLLSTGTKQILLTALPLYVLKPKGSIIFIDEPERSLYPDIQTQIVDIYSGLAEECQFFYATHSPIVASSFEPWEIVELKFKEDGTVYRELYYDENKENHVDNYFINPQYLRWDSILTKIFDLDMDSNPERVKQLMELAKIRSKIKKMNGSATVEEKQELMQKFEKLANLLDWEFDEKN